MAARLKVFVTSDGLTDYVVAVSSRAKALAAWGVRQDVFKEGQAYETDEPGLVEAALAQPGEVLRRPSGASGQLAKLKPAKVAKPKGPTKAQLKKVADLQAALTELQAAHETARAKAEAEREAAEARVHKLAETHEAERARLEAKLSAAQQALG
jgi:hypothetical protein